MNSYETFQPHQHVTVEHQGTIETRIGQRSVYIARHYDENGQEIYSMGTLVPKCPSLLLRAIHERQMSADRAAEEMS